MAKKSPQRATGPAFPDLQFQEPEPEKTQDAGADQAKLLADLQKQIGDLQADLDQQRKANLSLMAQPIVTAPVQEPTTVDLKDLPDPTLEPEKYAAEVANRTTRYIGQVQQAQTARQQQTQQQNGRVEALWEDFAEKYPEWAERADQVEYAATKVAQRAAQRGVDVNRYMFGASSTYMQDVHKELEKVFGKIEASADDVDDDGAPDDRTAGFIGGQDSGGRAAKGEDNPAARFQQHSMFNDVQEWQRKTGFTR